MGLPKLHVFLQLLGGAWHTDDSGGSTSRIDSTAAQWIATRDEKPRLATWYRCCIDGSWRPTVAGMGATAYLMGENSKSKILRTASYILRGHEIFWVSQNCMSSYSCLVVHVILVTTSSTGHCRWKATKLSTTVSAQKWHGLSGYQQSSI